MSQRHVIAFVVIVCISIVTVPRAFGQNTTVEDFRNEIKLLKKTTNELNKRIERLERELVNLKTLLNLKVDSKGIQRLTVDSNIDGWKNPSSWKKIRRGMSEKQVVNILGKPTSIKIIGDDLRTLFYQGEVSSSGYLSGNVGFIDDRVYTINKPVF